MCSFLMHFSRLQVHISFLVGALTFCQAGSISRFQWPLEDNASPDVKKNAHELYEAWTKQYDLEQDHVQESSDTPTSVAPHLELCKDLFELHKELEGHPRRLPDWIVKSLSPPWIRGSDAENIAHTRFMQTKLWRHQMASDCSSSKTKFLLVEWVHLKVHGMGSALHIFSNQLAFAMSQNRVLVPFPGSFVRADHPNCRGRHFQSLECFFFPVCPVECEKKALELWRSSNQAGEGGASQQVMVVPAKLSRINFSIPTAPLVKPWKDSPLTVELLGRMVRASAKGKGGIPFKHLRRRNVEVGWWHAQALRFLLRYPSEYLCHRMNVVRHQVYGWEVARAHALSQALQAKDLALLQEGFNSSSAEVARLKHASKVQQDASSASIERQLWWQEEPFLPRPIVSVHVRQGDKSREMQLFSLPSYLWLAEKLRRHSPSLKTVWLSTEMEDVVQQAKTFPEWTFLHTLNKRQTGNQSMFHYTLEAGVHELAVLSFVNLLISAQCDFFVGALGSNWNRLINELRLTGGKLRAGILALNLGELK